MNKAQLQTLLGDDAASWLMTLSSKDMPLHAVNDLDFTAPRGVEKISIGKASNDKEIIGYRWEKGQGPKIMVYGWPHPDEPVGALACRWMIENHDKMPDGKWLVIPAVDLEAGEYSTRWAHGNTLQDYIYGAARFEHLQREVDYNFPILSKLFYMPKDHDGARRCASRGKCMQPQICGKSCQRLIKVPGPLPESLALAHAIDMHKPEVVFGLHNASSGGTYSFFLQEPSTNLLEGFSNVSKACSLPRHMGIKIDPGKRWSPKWPDAMKEPRIEDLEKSFLRRHKLSVEDGKKYYAHASCAQYLEMRMPSSNYIVPEAGVFTHTDFGNTKAYEAEVELDAIIKDRVYELSRYIDLPWKETTRALYVRRKATEKDKPGKVSSAHTLGMIGIEAITLRRLLLDEADKLWQSLPEDIQESDNLIAAERRKITTPALYARQKMMRWLRTLQYQRAATYAEKADYQYRWALESCFLAGKIAILAQEHEPSRAFELKRKIDAVLDSLPLQEVRKEAALSQIGRIFYYLQEKS